MASELPTVLLDIDAGVAYVDDVTYSVQQDRLRRWWIAADRTLAVARAHDDVHYMIVSREVSKRHVQAVVAELHALDLLP